MRLPKPLVDEMKAQDLDEVMLIERLCFHTPWPRQIFEMELRSKRSFKRVSRMGGMVVGYIIGWTIHEEGHILNVAVHPDFRRLGIAESLLYECLAHFSEKKVNYAVLEVRRSNGGAIRLYEKLGFKPIGMRKGYYTDTGEDAIVMMLSMKSEISPQD